MLRALHFDTFSKVVPNVEVFAVFKYGMLGFSKPFGKAFCSLFQNKNRCETTIYPNSGVVSKSFFLLWRFFLAMDSDWPHHHGSFLSGFFG